MLMASLVGVLVDLVGGMVVSIGKVVGTSVQCPYAKKLALFIIVYINVAGLRYLETLDYVR